MAGRALCIRDQAVPLCVVKRDTIFLLQHHVGLGPGASRRSYRDPIFFMKNLWLDTSTDWNGCLRLGYYFCHMEMNKMQDVIWLLNCVPWLFEWKPCSVRFWSFMLDVILVVFLQGKSTRVDRLDLTRVDRLDLSNIYMYLDWSWNFYFSLFS